MGWISAAAVVVLAFIAGWYFNDDSEITNPLSPLRTQGIFQRYTPNLKNKYNRGANTIDGNSDGGTFNHNLQHSHGGSTGMSGGFGDGLDHKGGRVNAVIHTHGISSQFTNPTEIVSPKYFYCIGYMKMV